MGTFALLGTPSPLPLSTAVLAVFAQDWEFWWVLRREMSPGKIFARKHLIWMLQPPGSQTPPGQSGPS